MADVAERSDVSLSAMYRFMNHENKCSLSLRNLIALAGVVGLELTLGKQQIELVATTGNRCN